eukprot:scpid75523/ scgid11659/ 
MTELKNVSTALSTTKRTKNSTNVNLHLLITKEEDLDFAIMMLLFKENNTVSPVKKDPSEEVFSPAPAKLDNHAQTTQDSSPTVTPNNSPSPVPPKSKTEPKSSLSQHSKETKNTVRPQTQLT